jgi:hypothetical protein
VEAVGRNEFERLVRSFYVQDINTIGINEKRKFTVYRLFQMFLRFPNLLSSKPTKNNINPNSVLKYPISTPYPTKNGMMLFLNDDSSSMNSDNEKLINIAGPLVMKPKNIIQLMIFIYF